MGALYDQCRTISHHLTSLHLQASISSRTGRSYHRLIRTNASAPLGNEAGIRQVYKFGLYSYCGYLNDSAGTCTNSTIGNKYLPSNALLADMSLNYSALTVFIINGTSSFENQSLGSHTRSASYLILIGTICAFLALVIGVFKRTVAFFASACLAILATCSS
ncbi:hypothetical protein BJV77DRAFT_22227 [Russula vinacea]|nr:hypothetical protein BJV77DRAFT_22227 [Russula vinacea]